MNAIVWGATPQEHARSYPADVLVPGGLRLTRAIDVAAPSEVTWRWLCQLAVAPYSYDWIDNLGRRSPQDLTPGAERLEVGQRMAIVFRLTSYDEGRQWTGLARARGVGRCSLTYAAEPVGEASRIVVRMVLEEGGRVGWARARAIAWGDLVMMRRQLLNLRDLSQRRATI